jgi:hypothetical protein
MGEFHDCPFIREVNNSLNFKHEKLIDSDMLFYFLQEKYI